MPDEFDTVIGERGVRLSGGQRQRLAIARAVLADPKILILDDAFSSLDIETESIILGNIKKLNRSLTTVLITHRLGITREVDQIVVLDRGRVVESGIHETLMAARGLYWKMYKNQALAREMEILLQ